MKKLIYVEEDGKFACCYLNHDRYGIIFEQLKLKKKRKNVMKVKNEQMTINNKECR